MRPTPSLRFPSTVVSSLALGLICTLAAPVQAGQGSDSPAAAANAAPKSPSVQPAAKATSQEEGAGEEDRDYYARRAAEVLKQDSKPAVPDAHPLAAEHPDFNVVVCIGGCPHGKNDEIVSMQPKADAKGTATAGMMVATSSSAEADAAGSTIDCIAGCYDDTPKAYMARVAPKPPAPAQKPAEEKVQGADKQAEAEAPAATAEAQDKSEAANAAPAKSAEAAKPSEQAGAWETTVTVAPDGAKEPMPEATQAAQSEKAAEPGNWNDKVVLDRKAEKSSPAPAEPQATAKSEAPAAPAKPAAAVVAEAKPAEAPKAAEVKPAAPAAAVVVEAKPAEGPKAAEVKPATPAAPAAAVVADTKPAEAAKAAEVKPAAPAAPAAAAAVAETKPVEAPKAAESKPAAAAETKPAPAASAEAKPAAAREQKVAALEPAAKPAEPQAKEQPSLLRSGDAAMDAAINKARGSIGEFWSKLEKPAPGETDFALKVAIAEKDKIEYLWLTDLARKGDKITGTISNDPELVKTVKAGQRYDFTEDRIADWLFKRNGKLVGNETMRPLLEKMPKKEAETYRAMYEKP